MRLNLVRKNAAPPPPYTCELVDFTTESVPFVLGGIWLRGQKYWWLTTEDAEVGRQLLAKVGSELLMGCSEAIANALDNLYRQQEAIHRGTVYTVTGDGTDLSPYLYSPAIPLVPAVAEGEEPSVLFYLAKAVRLVDNLVNGTAYPDAPDIRNIRQQLDDILSAIGSGSFDDTEILAKLTELIALIGI